MNIKEILTEYLAANGYGGLYHDECGCFIEDIMPCGEFCCEHCEAAYRIPAHCATCEDGCDGRDENNQWCLTTIKPTS